MRLINIVNSYESMKILLDMYLPIHIGYQVSDIFEMIESEVNKYNHERNKLIKKYGTTTGQIIDGYEQYQFTLENQELFNKEFYELNDLEIDLKIEKIKLPENISIEAKNLYLLRELLER